MPDVLARYAHLAASTIHVGQLAGTATRHPFAPDGHTGTSCLACYGWADDARHAFHRSLGVRTAVATDG